MASMFDEFKQEVETDLTNAIKGLAVSTHAAVVEKAQKELKSTRDTYLNNLTFEEVSPGIWVVALDQPAMFIEEGLPSDFDMKPGLLKDGKVSKDGVRYRVIPFNHSTPPSQQTPTQQNITGQIKQSLRDYQKQQRAQGNKTNFVGIAKDSNGSPRVGNVHGNLNFGGPIPGKGNTPAMNGVNIYQTKTKTGNIRKDIMTFRTVTDQQIGKWIHPGMEAKKFMDKAFEEALQIWESQILPEVIARWEK